MNTSLVRMSSMAVYIALGLGSVLLIVLALLLLGAIEPDQTLTASWRRGG